MSSQHAQFFFDPAVESDVAEDYTYGRGLVGTNDQLTPSDDPPVLDPGAAGLWGLEHAALSAVALGVTTPIGVGTATASVDPPTTPITCQVVKIDFCAFSGETETHSFTPIGVDGLPLEITEPLVAIVEVPDSRDDLIFVEATYDLTTQEVSFDATLAEGDYQWAVRTEARNTVVGLGNIHVDYAADRGPIILKPHIITARLDGELLIGETIRISTDQAGIELVAELVTDSQGQINVSLAIGDYYAIFPNVDPTNSHPFSVS